MGDPPSLPARLGRRLTLLPHSTAPIRSSLGRRRSQTPAQPDAPTRMATAGSFSSAMSLDLDGKRQPRRRRSDPSRLCSPPRRRIRSSGNWIHLLARALASQPVRRGACLLLQSPTSHRHVQRLSQIQSLVTAVRILLTLVHHPYRRSGRPSIPR
jgi:hypothetical protein